MRRRDDRVRPEPLAEPASAGARRSPGGESALRAEDLAVAPGSCALCSHSRRITSARGSVFWLCGHGQLPRYPRLPVVSCPGFCGRDGVSKR